MNFVSLEEIFKLFYIKLLHAPKISFKAKVARFKERLTEYQESTPVLDRVFETALRKEFVLDVDLHPKLFNRL
jgi:hypothetical protein